MREALPHRPSLADRLGHVAILIAPAVILAIVAARVESVTVAIAVVPAVAAACILARGRAAWRPPTSGLVILLYLAALAWCWIPTRSISDTVVFGSRGLLWLGSVALLAIHDLTRTGAEPRRRAKLWCRRLQGRRFWPERPAEFAHLPEVRGVSAAAAHEPGPVFDLFADPRAPVRAAAFAALQGRPGWRPREASAILDEVKKTPEPEVRTIAVFTLASIDDPAVTQGLTAYFRDPIPMVRKAAVRAALGSGGAKWALVRDAVRGVLADPNVSDAGLPGSAGYLPVVAICDLTVWAGEPLPLGNRAIRTLIDHYGRILQTTGDYDLVTDLSHQVTDPGTSAGLRVELAALMRNLGLLTPELLDRMTNADQPGPVRLLAAEAMLTADPNHPDGLDVLRGLARQPNRDMALSIAAILQTRLGLDLGAPAGGLPAGGKQAIDVAKRVMAWATGRSVDARSATPTPGYLATASNDPLPLIPATPAPNPPPIGGARLRPAGPKPW